MTRRTAAERHRDTDPGSSEWPPRGAALVEALTAFHHPVRRQLYEVLLAHGPCSVGRLAELTGLAPGSVSHHLKPLHRHGFIEAAPDEARDTRESWWRASRRRLAWSGDDFEAGSVAREVGEIAERANFEHQTRAVVAWRRHRHALPAPWNETGFSSDMFVRATPEQLGDLEERLDQVLQEWRASCTTDEAAHPTPDRLPVRVVVRGFPSDPTWSER
ncbi:helix-turn-helix domain-containing protein [Luteipulveratus sp. YIM 133132]|uniref:ArsR/SmtB family transcription factor n=1 Tax=Luteipulveratus flavus TaxID=3031728 RepID=UPI0023B1A23A|nr:helix-turn-helix domain-containing protein [Luteipulveratus sp. YIM 133132]MDE9365243.1 helix-turn-helix domain-containing protein [Luteipulveratus sp. YIM 133132]